MPPIIDAKNAIAKAPEADTIQSMIKKAAGELGKALPAHLNPERIVRIALTCISLNPKLAQCTPASFMGSLFVLAQLGLEPIAGRAYLLPFNNKRNINGQWVYVKEVQALIGYKGYIDLFYRHEMALAIDMQTVHEKDEFRYQYGTESYLRHVPAFGERGPVVAYYALAKLKGGSHAFRVMSKEDALAHGQSHSKTFDKEKGGFDKNSPWSTEEDAMGMKTVLLQLSKVLPLSVEVQKAIAVDETSRDYREGIDDAMALPPTTSWDDRTTADVTASAMSWREKYAFEFAGEKKRLGKKYYEIIGGNGYEHSTEIEDEERAAKILAELRKA